MWELVTNTTSSLIKLINQIDSTECSSWSKWKSDADNHQIVVRTKDYYYKVYNVDFQSGMFTCEVREKLAQIYRSWGLHWSVKTWRKGNALFQVEQRQVLPLAKPDKILYKDLLIDWSKTLLELEQLLDLPKVKSQLKSTIKNLAHLKLVRDCVNKYEDYAIAPNGRIVLLDDADWFLALVDADNNWISTDWTYINIFRNTKEQVFAPIDFFDCDLVANCGKLVNQWLIFDSAINIDQSQFIAELKDVHNTMLADNIKCLMGDQDYLLNGEPLLAKQVRFDNEHIRQIMVNE